MQITRNLGLKGRVISVTLKISNFEKLSLRELELLRDSVEAREMIRVMLQRLINTRLAALRGQPASSVSGAGLVVGSAKA